MISTPGLLTLAAVSTLIQAAEHHIVVGPTDAPLTYDPPFITAALDDTIVFQFVGGNMTGDHTLTQSSFASPCTSAGGYDSGMVNVAADGTPIDIVLKVDTTDPIWFFCGTGPHCSLGMVFAVNPPTEGDTYEKFVDNAKNGATVSGTATNVSSSMVELVSSGTATATITPDAAMTSGSTGSMSTSMSSMPSSMGSAFTETPIASVSGSASPSQTSSAAPSASTSGGAMLARETSMYGALAGLVLCLLT